MGKQQVDAHRRILLKSLIGGGVMLLSGLPWRPGAAWPGAGTARAAETAADRPITAQGVRKTQGMVTINGLAATIGAVVKPGDTVVTGPDSMVIFVMEDATLMLRASTRLTVEGRRKTPEDLRVDRLGLSSGAMSGVFGPGERTIQTPTAVAAIRGTGIYVEAEAHLTYVCPCYGTIDIASRAAPETILRLETRHHEQPHYIFASEARRLIVPAPMINHTDAELILLESMVGRKPPFALPNAASGPGAGADKGAAKPPAKTGGY